MINIFIISLNYIHPLEEVDKHLAAHRQYLDIHYKTGIFITSGRKNPVNGGVILARAADKEGKIISRYDIETIMNNDPFIINKVAEYIITEFTPVKYSDEFKKILGT